jgi:hypothetical protein
MSLTLAEALKKLEGHRYEHAVWSAVVGFLSGCLDKETRKADHAIATEGCTKEMVPQVVIAGIIDSVNQDKIEPLEDSIEAFENLSVEDTDGKERKKKTTRKSGQSSGKKRVRSIRGPARQKLKGAS